MFALGTKMADSEREGAVPGVPKPDGTRPCSEVGTMN